MAAFETLKIDVVKGTGLAYLCLNRPAVSNALNYVMFDEFGKAVSELDGRDDVRVIVLLGAGANFCAGIDLSLISSMPADLMRHSSGCEARARERLRRMILSMQAAVSSVEHCRKPVIAGVHGACFGGAIDLITACDIRYCTADARFSVKEVDLAIAADLGTLQRLPKIVGEGVARELALTARTFNGQEAAEMRLVTGTFPTREALMDGVLKVAEKLTKKSPMALMGTKAFLLHARDNGTRESLDYAATWNAAMLLSMDMKEVAIAFKDKREPTFLSKL